MNEVPHSLRAKDAFFSRFKGKLGFWLIHCTLNAIPSYLIAVVWLQLWVVPLAHVAMFCAVVTFILGYSAVTSLTGPLNRKESVVARALRVGLILRMIISIITVAVVPTGVFLFFTPDLWCGQLAAGIVAWVYEVAGSEATLGNRYDDGYVNGVSLDTGFMEVYLTTIMEGLILSFMLFIFSFIAVIILQMRDRKKWIEREVGRPSVKS